MFLIPSKILRMLLRYVLQQLKAYWRYYLVYVDSAYEGVLKKNIIKQQCVKWKFQIHVKQVVDVLYILKYDI
jgi:hypothetical protein